MPGIVEGSRPVTVLVGNTVGGVVVSVLIASVVVVPTEIKTVGVGRGVVSVLGSASVVGLSSIRVVVVPTSMTVEVKNDAVLGVGSGVGVLV